MYEYFIETGFKCLHGLHYLKVGPQRRILLKEATKRRVQRTHKLLTDRKVNTFPRNILYSGLMYL